MWNGSVTVQAAGLSRWCTTAKADGNSRWGHLWVSASTTHVHDVLTAPDSTEEVEGPALEVFDKVRNNIRLCSSLIGQRFTSVLANA